MNDFYQANTICALATPQGSGAIAVIRLSGEKSLEIINKIFIPYGETPLLSTKSHTLRYGACKDESGELIDEVLVSIFRTPHSYTGENSVEISCHGSDYIVQQILMLLIKNGASNAAPGEFTRRAFLNGKMDLAQAEAVADLIASETKAAHQVALNQMKGGFSQELKTMRASLLDLVSLMELELDFSEEDVEFADRSRLKELLQQVMEHIGRLTDSFKLGNVIKNGVPVAIVGATNTGKSTLLNVFLGEDRAIVSNIHGTTRDSIEDTVNLGGITFRFIDTAGIRTTKETIEIIGIQRTYSKMLQASIIIMMLDAERPEYIEESLTNLAEKLGSNTDKQIVLLLNKAELIEEDPDNTSAHLQQMLQTISKSAHNAGITPMATLPISAKYGKGIQKLQELLIESQKSLKTAGNSTLVTNARHYEALTNAQESLTRVREGLTNQIPTDLVAQDLREALYHLGTITGEISTDEVLGNIFRRFCIGK